MKLRKINDDFLNKLYSKIKYVSDELRKISDKKGRDENANALFAMDFHITSMAMSHIVSRYYEEDLKTNVYSIGQVLLLRSLIEAIAVKRHIIKNEDELLDEVFKYQYYQFEYEIYNHKNFKHLDKEMFDLDQIKYNRTMARKIIVDKKADKEFSIKDVFKYKVPFINEAINFNDIILENLDDSFLMMYRSEE